MRWPSYLQDRGTHTITGLFCSLLVCLVVFSACGQEPSSASNPTPARESRFFAPNADDRIAYHLAWSWKGATWDASEKAYVFTTKLGYRVALSAGYIGTAATSLLPCQESRSRRVPALPVSPWRWLPKWLQQNLGSRSVFADHGYNQDRSFWEKPKLESFFSKTTTMWGSGLASGQAYCKLYLLFSVVDATASDGFAMKKWSTYLKGWYIAPKSEQRKPFEASVNLPGGALAPLSVATPLVAAQSLNTAKGTALQGQVWITRYPVQAFDTLKLDELAPLDLAFQFLLRVGQSTQATFQYAPSP